MSDASTSSRSRVLVTGAGGFIGSHLTADLVGKGRKVVALDTNVERLRNLGDRRHCELIEGDVTDAKIQDRALDGVGLVFHLAAAHLGASISRAEFWRVNVEGLKGLIERAGAHGVRRFVHCSSVGVYGRIEEVPADEETPCHPDLPYEESKLEGEQVVLQAVAGRVVRAVILRPVWVYGPGCPRTAKLFRAIKKGRFVVAGDGSSLRHCIYVKDMVDAFHLAAEAKAAVGQIVVVGDGRAVPVRELVDEIARLTGGFRPPSIPIPAFSALAVASELLFRLLRLEPPLSRRTLRFFTANTAFDIGRARRLLGFAPRFDLGSGLAETWRSLREEERQAPESGLSSSDG